MWRARSQGRACVTPSDERTCRGIRTFVTRSCRIRLRAYQKRASCERADYHDMNAFRANKNIQSKLSVHILYVCAHRNGALLHPTSCPCAPQTHLRPRAPRLSPALARSPALGAPPATSRTPPRRVRPLPRIARACRAGGSTASTRVVADPRSTRTASRTRRRPAFGHFDFARRRERDARRQSKRLWRTQTRCAEALRVPERPSTRCADAVELVSRP